MKWFGQEHAIDIGAFAIEEKVKHEATVRLHAENVLEVLAGESSNISDATEARVVVDKYVILGVRPESKADVVNEVFRVHGPVLEPATELSHPLFLPLVKLIGGEIVLDCVAERCADAHPLTDARGDDCVDGLLVRRRSLLLR